MDHTAVCLRHATIQKREGVFGKGTFHSIELPQAIIAKKQKLSLLKRFQSLEIIPQILFSDLLVRLSDNEQWIFPQDDGALFDRSGGKRTPSSSRRGF
jgi:hypothetical protein